MTVFANTQSLEAVYAELQPGLDHLKATCDAEQCKLFSEAEVWELLLKQSSGQKGYGENLRAAARGLWREVISREQFLSAWFGTVDRGLQRAWAEGLAECGIRPEEASPEEFRLLVSELNNNVDPGRIADLADFILDNSRESGGKWGVVASRVALWANRYPKLRTEAAAAACANKKKLWNLGPTEEHCRSCNNFNGRVYRYGTWASNGALPQSRALCCSGFNCLCDLVDTDNRITPGRFPRSLLCG